MSGEFVIATTLGHSGSRWFASTLRAAVHGARASHERSTKFPRFGKTNKYRPQGWFMHEAMKYQFEHGAGPFYTAAYFERIRRQLDKHAIVCDCRGWFPWSIESLVQRFRPARAVHLVRNGIQNVGSYWGCFCRGAELDMEHERFRWNWETARPGEPVPEGWSVFKKICFVWAACNTVLPQKLRRLLGKDAQVVQIEKLSSSQEVLSAFLRWFCPASELNPRAIFLSQTRRPGRHTKWLSEEERTPKGYWARWDAEKRENFSALCGDTMRRIGYEMPE